MTTRPNWLDSMLYGIRTVRTSGGELEERSIIRFLGDGVTAVDNESEQSIDVTIAGAPGASADFWDPVDVAAPSNVNLLASFEGTDGVTASTGMRVGLPNQTDRTQMGLYRVDAGGFLVRTDDALTADLFRTGMTFGVKGGDTYAGQTFVLATPTPITLGTSELFFVLQSPSVDVRALGAKGTGSTDDSARLLEAHVASKDIRHSPGTYLVDADVTLGTSGATVPRFTAGAKLKAATGRTVVLRGQPDAAWYQQILEGPGAWSLPDAERVHTGWLGALANGTTPDGAAIAATVDALPANLGTVVLRVGESLVDANITVGVAGKTRFTWPRGAKLKVSAGVDATLDGAMDAAPDQVLKTGAGRMRLGAGASHPSVPVVWYDVKIDGVTNTTTSLSEVYDSVHETAAILYPPFTYVVGITGSTTIAAGSNGQALPLASPTTIHVASTAGRTAPGHFYAVDADGVEHLIEFQTIDSGTTFGSCTSPGTLEGTLATSDAVFPTVVFGRSLQSHRVPRGADFETVGIITLTGRVDAASDQVLVKGTKQLRFFPDYPEGVPIRWLGAAGDGIVDDGDATQATTVAAKNVTIPPGLYSIPTTRTIGKASTVWTAQQGGRFKITPGQPVTFRGDFSRVPPNQVLVEGAGPGDVIFSDMAEVECGWFGATPGDVGAGVANSNAINTAHAALPSGGTIRMSVNGVYTTRAPLAFTQPTRLLLPRGGIYSDGNAAATDLITAAGALIIEGHDPYETALKPKAAYAAVKLLPRAFVTSGKETFLMSRVRCESTPGSGSRGVDTEGIGTSFSEGIFKIDQCNFTGQDIGVWLSRTVSYSHIRNTIFFEVNQGVYTQDNTELKIVECEVELSRNSTKAGVENHGCARFLVADSFLFSRRPNTQPNLLIRPSADGLDGQTWVRNTAFASEGMEDHRDAAHIVVGDPANPTWTVRHVHVSDCLFGGPAFLNVASITRASNVVAATVTCNANAARHGFQVGDEVVVAFGPAATDSFNGIFVVTAIGAPPGGGGGTQTVSWAQTGVDETVGSGGVIASAILSAIKLLSPVGHMIVSNNNFYHYANAIDDSATSSHTTLGESGQNIAYANHVFSPLGGPQQLFKRGGVSFSQASPVPGSGSRDWFGQRPRQNESHEIRNRLAYSEDFSNWAPGAGDITVTPGQTDPWGGTRASLLTRAGDTEMLTGSFPTQAIAAGIQIGIDDTGSPVRGVVSFWAKRGDALNQRMKAFVINATTGDIELPVTPVTLKSYWDRYTLPFCRLAAAGTRVLVICPGIANASPATAYVVGAQVADDDTDYVVTSGAAVVDTSSGNRFEKLQIHAALTASQAVVTDSSKRLASLAYTQAAAASALLRLDANSRAAVKGLISSGSAPTVADASGNLPGTIGTGGTFSVSGNDMCGVVSLNTGTTPGAYSIFDITFSATLPSAARAVCFPEDGAAAVGWGGGLTTGVANVHAIQVTNNTIRVFAKNLSLAGAVNFDASTANAYRIHYLVMT